MADYIGATPQVNPLMGLLAERLKQAQQFAAKPFGYSNPPAEMLMNLLGVPAVQQTAERLAYGEPITTGRGMTTQVRPEVMEAAMTVAPAAGLLGRGVERGAMAAGRAGERLAERVVPQVMERGGLPAQLLGDLAQGTQSNVLPPAKYRGQTLQGMPTKVDVGGKIDEFGTDQRLVDIAKDLTEKKGLVYSPQLKYAEIDPDRAKRLAAAYDKMENNPSNKAVKKSYDVMIDETMEQYETLRKKGYKFSFMPESGDIYGNPRNAINDIVQNQRLSVFPTEQGFGSLVEASQANPLLMKTGEKWNGQDVTANDVFRAVHDVFGHGKYGVGFRAAGEENAFQAHSRMYSPEALPAVTSETRGQNSWVNYGPYGEFNRKASPGQTFMQNKRQA